jgi:hypothetical protein
MHAWHASQSLLPEVRFTCALTSASISASLIPASRASSAITAARDLRWGRKRRRSLSAGKKGRRRKGVQGNEGADQVVRGAGRCSLSLHGCQLPSLLLVGRRFPDGINCFVSCRPLSSVKLICIPLLRFIALAPAAARTTTTSTHHAPPAQAHRTHLRLRPVLLL